MRRVIVDTDFSCCGRDFAIGELVDWPVNEPDRDYIGRWLGDEVALITDVVELHDDTTRSVQGRVVRIDAIYPSVASGAMASPLGSYVGEPRDRTGAERRDFVGYLVDVDDSDSG